MAIVSLKMRFRNFALAEMRGRKESSKSNWRFGLVLWKAVGVRVEPLLGEICEHARAGY